MTTFFQRLHTVALIGLVVGCIPMLKKIRTNPDGSEVVALPDMNVQLTVPGGARLTSTSSSASVVQWDDNAKGIRIEKRNTSKHTDAAALSADLERRYRMFEANETETLPNGLDIAYTYRASVNPVRGYEAEIVLGETTYGCYMTAGTTDAAVEVARKACRSLAASNQTRRL